MKIQCDCGQKFAFDATPEMLRNPITFACPACQVDLSARLNYLVQQQLAQPAAPAGLAGAPAMEIAPPPQGSIAPPPPVAPASPPAAAQDFGPIGSFMVRVNFTGDYREIAYFLEGLREIPRLVTVQSLQLRRRAPVVSAEVVLRGYYRKGSLPGGST